MTLRESERLRFVSQTQGTSKETDIDVTGTSARPAYSTARHVVHLSWITKMNSFRKSLSLSLYGQIAKLHSRNNILNMSLKITTLLDLRIFYLPNKFAFE